MSKKSYKDLLDISVSVLDLGFTCSDSPGIFGKALTMTINALSVAADVLISLSLCIIFQRSKTGFRRSDTILTKLVRFVVLDVFAQFMTCLDYIFLKYWIVSLFKASLMRTVAYNFNRATR